MMIFLPTPAYKVVCASYIHIHKILMYVAHETQTPNRSSAGRERSMQGGCAFLARESEAWWYLHPLCGVYFSFTLWVPHPPPLAVFRTEQKERPVFRVRCNAGCLTRFCFLAYTSGVF